MAFKDLHKLKKIEVIEKENINVAHLVVGKDIFAVSLYLKLKEIYGASAVRLLSEDAILRADLFPKGPSLIRGESNHKIMRTLFSDAIDNTFDRPAMFYKDMTWKSFAGRSKSEALIFDEEFYTGARLNVDYDKIFPTISDATLEEVNKDAYQVRLKAIKRNGIGFTVECINGTEFSTEKFYFALSPARYLSHYSTKSELSDEFIQFCESTKTSSALFVKFIFSDKPLSDLKETLFIPLSYTHEWGHFIGEFSDHSGVQEIEFIHFLDEDQASEEDVSRIIRLLKRNMEKIFENFLKIKSHDFIALEQEIGCLKIDDALFAKAIEKERAIVENLFFIGMNAPIQVTHNSGSIFEYSTLRVSGMARGLLAYQEILKKI